MASFSDSHREVVTFPPFVFIHLDRDIGYFFIFWAASTEEYTTPIFPPPGLPRLKTSKWLGKKKRRDKSLFKTWNEKNQKVLSNWRRKVKSGPGNLKRPGSPGFTGFPSGYMEQKCLDYHKLPKLFIKIFIRTLRNLVWNSQEQQQQQEQHVALLDLGVSLQVKRKWKPPLKWRSHH